MKTIILTGLVTVMLAGNVFQSSELERIGLAIQTGNSKELAKYFDTTVEIAILDNEQSYSKAQAEMVLKDFFTKNKPASFKIMHNGASQGGLQYGIGTLVTSNLTYRTTIYLKQKGDTHYIQTLRFEND